MYFRVYTIYHGVSGVYRVCVQTCLPPGVSVQIDAVAYRASMDDERKTMHVQSVSHWAPANIGPYSQAVRVRLSGQLTKLNQSDLI